MRRRKFCIALFGAIVVVGLILPSICVALITPMPPACHNHGPARNTSHACCHPGHPLPMAARTLSPSIRTAEIVQELPTPIDAGKLKTSAIRTEIESSPPSLAVLRI
jgi:hypothetical protein